MTADKFQLLDLFSGIGGFSLGLERSGYFETVAFCEIEPYPQRILKKHWKDVPLYDDIRTLSGSRLAADGIRIDAICGGFPCQEVSNAGAAHGVNIGLGGGRSGLWFEYLRIIRETRPRVVVVENVTALLVRGIGDVLRGLAEIGYDAEWRVVSGEDIGAPQIRERIWIVAYPPEERIAGLLESIDFGGFGQGWEGGPAHLQQFADAPFIAGNSYPQPLLRGVDDRPAHWVDRIGACGNAVIPQIPEIIGRAIGERMFHAE